ncbi:MAG: sulfotransferase domain-containing protein [Saprospiraceae bacterium]
MLPNFIIGGAPKCGTTSLAITLSHHKDIFIPSIKEVGFFNNDENWKKGLDWYKSFFEENSPLIGDATPHYISSAQGIERIKSTIPDIKIIYIIRNPIKRAHSHFWFRKRGGIEHRTFIEALKDELETPDNPKNYLIREGCYSLQIKKLLKHFQGDQLLFFVLEDFKENSKSELEKVYNFLNVEVEETEMSLKNQAVVPKSKIYQNILLDFTKGNSLVKKMLKNILGRSVRKLLFRKAKQFNNRVKEKPNITEEEFDLLKSIYSEEVNALKVYFNRDFSDWLIR